LQREDERPSPSGRPSLLSKEPAAEAGRSGILDGLERKPAAAAVGKPAPRKTAAMLAVAGVGVLGLAIAAVALWPGTTPEPELTLPVAAATPPASRSDTAVTVAAPAAVAPAATIVEDTAALSPAVDNSRTLKQILNDTPAKPQHDELTAAFDHPHAAPAKPKPPAKKTVQVAKKPDHPAKKPAPADNDVTLLAALMAHVQSNRQSKETSSPAYQLKQCKRMNEAGATQCREHLCSTSARNEPECKQQPVAVKTASES